MPKVAEPNATPNRRGFGALTPMARLRAMSVGERRLFSWNLSR
jgi:hypothetical protein